MMHYVDILASLPAALMPFYASPGVNEPIILFRGRVDLSGATTTEQYPGELSLDWLPTPSVSCQVSGPLSTLALHATFGTENVEAKPRISLRHVPTQVKPRKPRPVASGSAFENSFPMRRLECGDHRKQLAYALLHVANLPQFLGRPITWATRSSRAGRLLFEGGGWSVTLDPVELASELEDVLKRKGGYALTNTARVERTSGATFTSAELKSFSEAFTYFCWLCAEMRCGPVLPVGFDHRSRAIWSDWSAPWIESFPTAATWLDSVHSGEAEALFPTFMARFEDPYWCQVLKHGIHYLIEAGRPNTLERAIVMAQILLEGLSYSWLVEETKRRTDATFESHTAAQNIRMMLSHMGIPVVVPKELKALQATRTRKGTKADGPLALVLKRNEAVHRRSASAATDYPSLIDAWVLGAWYAELALLRICGFNGLYRSRLSEDKWTGSVEKVPWT
jgi:hypothetical protein